MDSGWWPGRAFQVIQASALPELRMFSTALPSRVSALVYRPLPTGTTSPGCAALSAR